MNKIDWKVGNTYTVNDIQDCYESVLEGFIVNQCPVSWENKDSYSNCPDNTVYLVLSFNSRFDNNEKRFVLSVPSISNRINDTINYHISSEIILYGKNYGTSIEQLIKKLQQNYVFTKELCYDAKYKEGFKWVN